MKNMLRNHKLARHISSASWSKFFDMLTYKSVWYGNAVSYTHLGELRDTMEMCGAATLADITPDMVRLPK